MSSQDGTLSKPEITDQELMTKWAEFKKDADQILGDLKILGNQWMD
jgi:hypothetical protein